MEGFATSLKINIIFIEGYEAPGITVLSDTSIKSDARFLSIALFRDFRISFRCGFFTIFIEYFLSNHTFSVVA